jgi:hypothetical protein
MSFDSIRQYAENKRAERQAFLESCPPTSTYGMLAKLPVQIKHYPLGFIVELPLTGLWVVPFEHTSGNSWACAVVKGNDTYPVGGHHLSISHDEIERGIRHEL